MATPLDIPTEPLSIDDVLPLIGEFGKFQILLEIAFCIMIFPGSMLILIPYFAQHNPPWMCVANSTVCHLNGTYDTQSKFYKERCKMPRSEWQFTKPKEYSIMTQFDLYCETEVYSYLATSLVFVSWAVGAIVLGWTSDRYGRRLTLLPSMAILVVLGFITSFSPTLWFYILTRSLMGFFLPGARIQMFVLISEFVGPKWRPFAGISLWFSFALSVVLLGVIAIFVQTWKILMIVVTAPYFVTFLFFKFIPESTRWLHVNGRTDEAVAIFRKIAKFNGKELPDITLKPVPMDCSPGLTHYLHLFKPKKVAIRSLIQGCAWVVGGLVFFGVSFGADDFSGNMYRDYILASLVDLPATTLAIYCCNKIGRKKTVLIPMFISGISCIAVSLIPVKAGGKTSDLIGLRVFFGVLGKFSITMSFNSIYTWSAELYPTVIRGAGMGYLQIAGRLGSAMAPWVAKSLAVFHVVLPFSIMGGSAVICAILLLWLPETADKKTLESLGDQFKENDNVKASES
ncbi:solute carrier family 22 member 15-like [Rhopilema esculentum]|uniref:solute carrier family 22 member 15-like n=1 Tax=Rhopilema esculentum TaxID=499914 RepID=UPI0031DC5193